MNTLYFYTDSIVCEQSTIMLGCKEFKQILTDNDWPYILVDLNNNPEAKKYLNIIIGRVVSLPQFIIKNNTDGIVAHFSSMDIIREFALDPLNCNNLDLTYIQLALESKLIKYQVI
jgi:glutaredoxin